MVKVKKQRSVKEKLPLINNPTIGADIEVFLRDKYTKDIVSAEGIIKGAKDDPFIFSGIGTDVFATSLDNVMVEFNIPPAKTSKDFSSHILYALGWIEGSIPQNLQLLAHPSARIDNKYLQTENAKMFGCDPDFNAWLMGAQNPKPDALGDIRSCGGHIHIGYEKPHGDVNMELIRVMDIFIGLPSILQEPENDRKSLYGKAGAFRHKRYGCEYRTISNYYINSPELMQWAFDNTLTAIEFVNRQQSISGEESVAIQTAINTNDKALAQTMCSYFGVKLAA